jgi:Flp pilus assembly protein TadG
MKPLAWLRNISRNEKGNVLVIGASVMPLIIAGAALAVDTIQIGVWNRQMQRAADSSALAGAYALTQLTDPANETDFVTDAVHRDLDRNYFPTLSETEIVEIGPRLGFDRTVRVRITTDPVVPFIGFFTGAPATIAVEATAAIIQDGNFCVLSLYDGDEPGIDLNGNAEVDLGCGVAANSGGEEAVTAGGSSALTARPIMARGGLRGSSNNFVSPTTLQPHSARQEDPFINLPHPPVPNNCTALSVGTQDTVTLPTGNYCFSSADIKGTLNIGTGSQVTVYGGNLSFGAQANVTAPKTNWFMTGPDGAAGDLEWNAQATLNLSAPTSGEFANILFYRDRRASNVEIKINGGASATLSGAFYFPTSDITFTGHAGLQVSCLQMVGQILRFRGTSSINNSCNVPGADDGFELTYVRLVG